MRGDNMTETEMREEGFQWQNVERCFLWGELSKDFIREIVEYDEKYKTWLEHALLMDFHGYSVHASAFYMNMYTYIKSGMAEQKELSCYVDQVYQMYWNQREQQYNARVVHTFKDGMGRVLDQWVM